MHELLYTSAPRGLKPGSRGFCTVLSTKGMVAPLAAALEGLSGYRPVFPIGHARVAENPVVYSHLKLQVAGKPWYVLSRIADYGLDYSQRTNKLAHHLVLDKSELPAAGPASLLRASGILRESWEGDPKIVPPKPMSKQPSVPSAVCQAWKELTGDAGWAGVLAESFLKDPNRPVILLFEPGQDLRPLFDESLSLLPAERRWDVTFSTYFTGASQGITCLWRGIVLGSKEATESRRFVNALRIDLTSTDIGRAEGGELVEAARKGIRLAVRPTLPPKQTASREQQSHRVVVLNNAEEPTEPQAFYKPADTKTNAVHPVANHDHSLAPPRLTPSVFKFANSRRLTEEDDQVGRKSSVRKHRILKVMIATVVLLIVLAIGFAAYLAIQARASAQILAAIDGFIAAGKLEDARKFLDQNSSRATSEDRLAVKEKLDAADQKEQDRQEELKSVLNKVAGEKDPDSALKELERGRELARTSEEKDAVDKLQKPWREKKKEQDRQEELKSVLNKVADEKDPDSALKQLERGRELAITSEEKDAVGRLEEEWREKKKEQDRQKVADANKHRVELLELFDGAPPKLKLQKTTYDTRIRADQLSDTVLVLMTPFKEKKFVTKFSKASLSLETKQDVPFGTFKIVIENDKIVVRFEEPKQVDVSKYLRFCLLRLKSGNQIIDFTFFKTQRKPVEPFRPGAEQSHHGSTSFASADLKEAIEQQIVIHCDKLTIKTTQEKLLKEGIVTSKIDPIFEWQFDKSLCEKLLIEEKSKLFFQRSKPQDDRFEFRVNCDPLRYTAERAQLCRELVTAIKNGPLFLDDLKKYDSLSWKELDGIFGAIQTAFGKLKNEESKTKAEKFMTAINDDHGFKFRKTTIDEKIAKAGMSAESLLSAAIEASFSIRVNHEGQQEEKVGLLRLEIDGTK